MTHTGERRVGRAERWARALGTGVLVATMSVGCTLTGSGRPAADTGQAPSGATRVSATRRPDSTATATHTPLPTLTPTATRTPTATPLPGLTWRQLRNLPYPLDLSADGIAALEDGIYREKYLPDSVTELVIGLADMHAFGDINGDRVDDAVVLLVAHPGGSGTFFYLAAVLNEDGVARPSAPVLLGDRVIVRSMAVQSGQITLEMITSGPEDPMCCPNQDSRRIYDLDEDELILVSQWDGPRQQPAVPQVPEPEVLTFPPGADAVTVRGSIFPIGDRRWILHGEADQLVDLVVTSPYDHVFVSLRGLSDNAVLVSVTAEDTAWHGRLPSSQDYLVTLVSIAGSATSYDMTVALDPAPSPPPQATPTVSVTPTATVSAGAAPTGTVEVAETVVASPTIRPPVDAGSPLYLTFDDGPTWPSWTPQILETLGEYQAQATFFVLGQQAARYPELIQAESAAGHTIANHTYGHQTLDDIGRDAFFEALTSTQSALGDEGVACIRPPYGAMDAYTRAYAAELGYAVVLWDIDTEDWRKPGADVIADRVLAQARPGAIVLFHDGGGDREQTVAALRAMLPLLQEQGYVFEVVCR